MYRGVPTAGEQSRLLLGCMESPAKKVNPVSLAREILNFRKTKHPYGYNYAVRVRMGHAEIQDLTALADVVLAIEELGYEIVKKS
jgi:hypothetical protein